jgi:hypothetical protein
LIDMLAVRITTNTKVRSSCLEHKAPNQREQTRVRNNLGKIVSQCVTHRIEMRGVVQNDQSYAGPFIPRIFDQWTSNAGVVQRQSFISVRHDVATQNVTSANWMPYVHGQGEADGARRREVVWRANVRRIAPRKGASTVGK